MTQTFTIKIGTPEASLPAGAIPNALAKGSLVTLSCDVPGASIYYTIDDSTPNGSSSTSTLYASPIPVNADMTLKAIAVYSGMVDSEIMAVSYTLVVYTVTFDENYPGGSPSYAAKTASDGSPLGSNMPAPPEREGWQFIGWDHEPEPVGGGTVFDENSLVNANIKVYAQWEEEEEDPGGGDPEPEE